ncbi:MFS transporter [Enterobacter sp. 10-1]|uniref:MFS transporter n=1 Tax=Raoultella sp. 10-1 TaxID=2683201 RepID=UPI000BA306DD|nr:MULTISPECIES: MFS transporter [Enterobacteriaceae]MVT05975.1 MFS transporter [Raoultella sp. 10-1]PAC07807.1 MFS transporter [Enterobacter sp. 10-1]
MSDFSLRPPRVITPILLIGAIILGAATLRAPLTSVGPVLAPLAADLGLDGMQAGILNALPLLLFALLSPPAAILGKRFGLEPVLAAAMALIAGGTFIRSFGTPSCLWIGTVSLGIGIAIGNVLLISVIKRDLSDRAALCIGLYAAAMALSASVASGVAAPLAAISELGWRIATGIWCVPAAVAFIAWFVIGRCIQNHAGADTAGSHTVYRSPWLSAVGWQVSLFMAMHTLVFYTLIDWFPSMARNQHISAAESGFYLLAYQAIAVVANLATSRLLKHASDQRAIGFFASFFIFIGIVGLWFIPASPLIWLVLAGIGAGMSMVTCLSLFGLRTRDHVHAGQLSGMAQGVGYALGAMGPWLTGVVHDAYDNWTPVLAMLLAAAIVQMVVSVLAGRTRIIGE